MVNRPYNCFKEIRVSNASFIDPKRIPALDGIRGIAFLMVFGAHIGILDSGFLGVDLFLF